MKKPNTYRQSVAKTVARLKTPTRLEAAIAASQRLAGNLRAKAMPAIEVDHGALQRIQEGQDRLRRARHEG